MQCDVGEHIKIKELCTVYFGKIYVMEIVFMFLQFHFKVSVFSDVPNYNMKNIFMCVVVKRNFQQKVLTVQNTISK